MTGVISLISSAPNVTSLPDLPFLFFFLDEADEASETALALPFDTPELAVFGAEPDTGDVKFDLSVCDADLSVPVDKFDPFERVDETVDCAEIPDCVECVDRADRPDLEDEAEKGVLGDKGVPAEGEMGDLILSLSECELPLEMEYTE